MPKIKRYLYHTLRLSVTLMTLGAFLFNSFASGIRPAGASPVEGGDQMTPGLRAAIQEAIGPEVFVPAVEVAKLSASDGAAGDIFGASVALSGDTALVGAYGDDDVNLYSHGAAYIFERNQGGADNWGQVKKLTPPTDQKGGSFGVSVALSGDTAIVGARWADVPLDNLAGAAYIFERDQGGAGNWSQVKRLTASDGEIGDNFGQSVALSGGTALVGARWDKNGVQPLGSAYIFERDQGGLDNWGEVKKLTASDGGERFGFSVALSGDTALVGARYGFNNGHNTGSAYIFERDQGGVDNWGEVKKLLAADGTTGDRFGVSVALSEDTALVGASEDDDDGSKSGSAYIFERDNGGAGNWGEVKKLIAQDGAVDDEFGRSVALNGDTALVGAYNDDDLGTNSGSVYFFERDQDGIGNWGEVKKLTASDGAANDRFGRAVALSEGDALVGAKHDDDNGANSGSAYIYISNLLDNGGFENPLGAEWEQVVSGNGDGPVSYSLAQEGESIYRFEADGGLEVIKQDVAASGIAGDEYTLTLYFGGKDVDLSGKLGARLMFKNGGVKVDKKICIFTPPSSSFFWASFTCTLTATGAFDSIEVLIGIKDVPSGMVGVDAAILNKTGP